MQMKINQEERKTTRQVRSLPTTFTTRDDEKGKHICGYFAVFNSIYEWWPGYTEEIIPGAFDGQTEGDVRALTDHVTHLVLGRTVAETLKLTADEKGLYGDILINEADTDALNLYARVKRGDVSQCSFGFDILDEEVEYREDGSVHYKVNAVKLYEVSVVTFPAYEETTVEARKLAEDNKRKRKLDAEKSKLRKKVEALKC